MKQKILLVGAFLGTFSLGFLIRGVVLTQPSAGKNAETTNPLIIGKPIVSHDVQFRSGEQPESSSVSPYSPPTAPQDPPLFHQGPSKNPTEEDIIVEIPEGLAAPASLAEADQSFNEIQKSVKEALAEEFLTDISSLSKNDPDYLEQWSRAQRANDDRFRLFLGANFYMQQHKAAFRPSLSKVPGQ